MYGDSMLAWLASATTDGDGTPTDCWIPVGRDHGQHKVLLALVRGGWAERRPARDPEVAARYEYRATATGAAAARRPRPVPPLQPRWQGRPAPESE